MTLFRRILYPIAFGFALVGLALLAIGKAVWNLMKKEY